MGLQHFLGYEIRHSYARGQEVVFAFLLAHSNQSDEFLSKMNEDRFYVNSKAVFNGRKFQAMIETLDRRCLVKI